MPADASDLPLELLRKILFWVTIDDQGNPRFAAWRSAQLTKEDRRELATCIMTCVDWAKQFRSLLFQRVVLRSADDVRMLASLATTPPSARFDSVKLFINHVDIDFSPVRSKQPWLHHIYPMLEVLGHPYDPEERQYIYTKQAAATTPEHGWAWGWTPMGFLGIDVVIRADAQGATSTWKHSTLHAWLPRKLPRCYHAFRNVTLEDIHFPSLSNILRVVKELETLTHLRLRRVTWDASRSSQLSDPVRFGLRQVAFTVEAGGCTDDALVAFLALCELPWAWSRQDNMSMVLSDVQNVYTVTEWVYKATLALRKDTPEKDAQVISLSNRVITDGLHIDAMMLLAQSGRGIRSRAISPKVMFHTGDMQWPPIEPAVPSEPQQVQHVTVEFFELSFSEVVKFDWVTFVDLITTFPRLRSVVLGFDSGEDDMYTFLETHGDVVHHLKQHTGQGLKILYRDPNVHGHARQNYIAVDPNTLEPLRRRFRSVTQALQI